MRVLFFGTFDENVHPRVRVLREGLAESGIEVETLNRPIGDSTAVRVAAGKSLWRGALWGYRLLRRWLGLLWASFGVKKPDAIVIGYLGVFDVIMARVRWPRSSIVLDHLAPLRGIAADRGIEGVGANLMGVFDRLAERCADLVLYDTEENAWGSGRKGLVVAVGADSRWFETRRMNEEGPLRVMFFGLFTPLHGAKVIGEAIAMLKGKEIVFTLVGVGQDRETVLQATEGVDSVTWVEWINPDELPQKVANHDVCLGIFGTTEKAFRVVPNKVYQGIAAGCVVVTSDTIPQRRALGEAAIFVEAGSAVSLRDALESLVEDRSLVEEMQRRSKDRGELFRSKAVVEPLVKRLDEELT